MQININLLVVCLAIASYGCDQTPFGNRYEISKDQSGRTVRLDKRTGEIAVIDGDRVVQLRDAKDVDSARKTEEDNLARAKTWPKLDLPHFGFDAWLQTSWQDGSVLYQIRFTPIAKKDEKGVVVKGTYNDSKAAHRTFTLHLEDAPFELATQQLKFNRVVDDDGKPVGRESRGKISMSKDVYRRVDAWNLSWSGGSL